MGTFQCLTSVAAPIEVVFDLSRNIDFHKESMAKSNEEAIAGVTSGLISEGETVTWKATHFFIPFRMTSRITQMEPPHSFTDEQVKGPFKTFRHLHRFEATPTGTNMEDLINFTAPIGPIGTIVDRIVLGSYMKQLIQQRNNQLKAAAEQH